MQNDLATQVTLAQIKPGMFARTTLTPKRHADGLFLVDSEHPRISKGKPRKVVQNVTERNVGRYLIFDDATRTSPRNGTAMVWIYKTGPDGKPLPEPVYPKCPTCGSDDPGCRTKEGAWAPNMHAARTKLMAKAPISKGHVPVPVELHRTDAATDEALAGEPGTEKIGPCGTCKGFGLVRKRGPQAGQKYRTLNGAQSALANGNAVDCPSCHGTGAADLAA